MEVAQNINNDVEKMEIIALPFILPAGHCQN